VSIRFFAILVAYVGTGTPGLVLMRSELRRPHAQLVSWATVTNWRILLAFGLYATSFLCWLLAVQRYELTTAYPFFTGVGYTALMIFAVLVLGEHVNLVKGLGIALVGAGLILVASQ
jgi:undecaprenyl phosphate-alpha-L-ara4N flippase subunit ArnF